MLFNKTQNKVITKNTVLANSFLRRLKGLSLTSSKPIDTAWIFPKCQIIHMYFMFFPLGLIYLDRQKKVVKCVKRIKPWTISPFVRKAHYVVEVLPEVTQNINVGDLLEFESLP
ncbi:MAG: DUF192 domain-containing protein [Candidatus Margulisiibacteriota bacterium]